MKMHGKIATVLTIAAALALESGSAAAGMMLPDVVGRLPGPDTLGLVAAGIVAAVYVARRLK